MKQKVFLVVKAILVWLLFFILMLLIVGEPTEIVVGDPGEEESYSAFSWWQVLLVLLVPTAAAWLIAVKGIFRRIKKKQSEKNDANWFSAASKKVSEEETNCSNIDLSQEELAQELLLELSVQTELANETTSIEFYLEHYDSALDCLEQLSDLDDVSFKPGFSPTIEKIKLKNELQLNLCDALCRCKDNSIEKIKNKYKNSREFQEKEARYFKGSVENVRSRFSEGTSEFADQCISEIAIAAGISPVSINSEVSESIDMSEVDQMDGFTFETWCADLLARQGFNEVQVTRGSGDQGVDILASKGGIKYAIQCKNYSSDLGNTPIQEVNTGKTVYGCQIAAVMTNRYFTKGGKDAAKATGVLLWDRDWISARI